MKRLLSSLLSVFLLTQAAQAQEYLAPLADNPVLRKAAKAKQPVHRGSRILADTIPFIDDFSFRSPYPDPDKWADSTVFVNDGFGIHPPSIGVATFDGLGPDGIPYSNGANAHGRADSLTTWPLKLDGLTPADSLYLSFFYQAGGYGNHPESNDSLVVQFLANNGQWRTVWRAMPDTVPDTVFQMAMIPVKKAAYFYNGFRFRFLNYATLTGNLDHWNVDYVKLDKDRSINDKLLNDVAFNRPAPSLLARYEAMPLNQFQGFSATEIAPSLKVSASNHFNVIKNTTFSYEARELCTNSVLNATFIETINFPALSDTVLSDPNFETQLNAYLAGNTCDSLVVAVKYYLTNTPPDFSTTFNDTVIRYQRFFNYFAYDDGTAEQAYGLQGTGAMAAYEFEANTPDTLRAIAIHFAHIGEDLSNRLFSLIIWDQLDVPAGINDHILYRQDFMTPAYIDTFNGFATYVLDTPQVVSGKFFIGWQQSQPDNLSIGFDKNHDASSHLYYNVFGNWNSTAFHGALMLRPLLGKPIQFPVGLPAAASREKITVYPNPAGEEAFVCTAAFVKEPPVLYNLTGQRMPATVEAQSFDPDGILWRVSLSGLAVGVYVIRSGYAAGLVVHH